MGKVLLCQRGWRRMTGVWQRFACIGDFLDRRRLWWRPRGELLHVRVVGVKLQAGRCFLNPNLLLLFLLGVGLVGIFAFAYGLEDARGIPLGELDLLEDLGLGFAPLTEEVKESGSRIECVGSLPGRRLADGNPPAIRWVVCERQSPTLSPCWRAESVRHGQTSAKTNEDRSNTRQAVR